MTHPTNPDVYFATGPRGPRSPRRGAATLRKKPHHTVIGEQGDPRRTRVVNVYFMRHAQSESNAATGMALVGTLFRRDPPITPLGRAQTARTRAFWRHTPPDIVLASVLLRAQQTAALTFPHLHVRVCPGMSEVGKEPWASLGLRQGNTPLSPEAQRGALRREGLLNVDHTDVLDTDGQFRAAARRPNQDTFLAYLAHLVAEHVQTTRASHDPINVVVCTHGNLIGHPDHVGADVKMGNNGVVWQPLVWHPDGPALRKDPRAPAPRVLTPGFNLDKMH